MLGSGHVFLRFDESKSFFLKLLGVAQQSGLRMESVGHWGRSCSRSNDELGVGANYNFILDFDFRT